MCAVVSVVLVDIAQSTRETTSITVVDEPVARTPSSAEVAAAEASGAARVLVEGHGCWTDQAPSDMERQVPGHVVVIRGADTVDAEAVYGGVRLTGVALDAAFGRGAADFTIVGFCR